MDENIKFAYERAAEQKLPIKTVCGDARTVDTLVSGQFDHVLLMGPMYHLLEESDRITSVNAALNLLKEKLHLFGQESVLAPNEPNVMKQPPEVIAGWLDLAEKLWEKEEYLSWSEHLMYVGKKI